MKKIDIHAHTTKRVLSDMAKNFASLENIFEEAEKHDVEQTIVLATYFPHRESGISNYRLKSWIDNFNKKNGLTPDVYEIRNFVLPFKMFGSLDFEHYYNQGYSELEEMAENNDIKGIKIYTTYQNIDLKSDKFKNVVLLAEKHTLPLMMHLGFSYSHRRKTGNAVVTEDIKASDIEWIANSYEVPIIISHMAKPHFDDLSIVIKRNKNIYTDMSGLIDSKYNRDEIPTDIGVIKKFLGECGPKKLLFGTDFPVQTHEDSINFIEESMKEYSEKDKEDVYYNNASKLLNRKGDEDD